MSAVTHENPFDKLYLSEAISDPRVYSRWFSPTIITGETRTLFHEGNTVLRGSNGIGKTMLLRLFSPEVRAAYLENPSNVQLPVELGNSLGINVNLLHAGFGTLGTRRLEEDEERNRQKWGLVFGDFLNYYVIAELLTTLNYLRTKGMAVASELGVRVEAERLDRFASALGGDACWFGGLRRPHTFETVHRRLRRRVATYRSFVNWNMDVLPTSVSQTKTVIGTPLLVAREALRTTGIIGDATAIVVMLDQYESLYHVDYGDDDGSNAGMGWTLCRAVNSLLAQRRSGVFFKIGVRHYAWGKEARSLNTEQRLELGRDYQLVDLDKVLRREENPKSWIFPEFAKDVAARRIAENRTGNARDYQSWLRDRLESLTPDEEINKYCQRDPAALRPDAAQDWPEWVAGFLRDLFDESKYEAKLAEAWFRQDKRQKRQLADWTPWTNSPRPWKRRWWAKERREALLAQMASACRQRKLYAGWDTLVTLSGGNILIFINLCREIWDHWSRAQRDSARAEGSIAVDIQSQAVRIVANDWLEKQKETPRGATRKAFVVRLGIGMRAALLEDRSLSYPGHTGFSLSEGELEDEPQVSRFLETAAEYGALVGLPHTTKKQKREPRRKWYLSPILCPNFEIPAIRTKEPYYAGVHEVAEWIGTREGNVAFRNRGQRRKRETRAPSLFQS